MNTLDKVFSTVKAAQLRRQGGTDKPLRLSETLVSLGKPLVLILLWGLTGCSGNRLAPSGSDLSLQDPGLARLVAQSQSNSEEYRLRASDELSIKFAFHPEENEEAVLVQPDGKIMLRLVGEVQAAGLTPKELGTLIAQKAAVFLRDPEVTVAVKKIDERVYVGGEVQKPNFVILRERMTPLQAIIEVGGLLETANVENVILIRQGENGYTTHIIDLDDTINQGVPEQFTLAPDDVVYVPRTAIANANIWVRQHITEMLPIRPRIPWGY